MPITVNRGLHLFMDEVKYVLYNYLINEVRFLILLKKYVYILKAPCQC